MKRQLEHPMLLDAISANTRTVHGGYAGDNTPPSGYRAKWSPKQLVKQSRRSFTFSGIQAQLTVQGTLVSLPPSLAPYPKPRGPWRGNLG